MRLVAEAALPTLILCSRNEHKLRELRAVLPEWDVQPLHADDYPEETADTYEENARGKARYGRRLAPSELWVVGEDAGIEVEALGWGPGPRSARWSDRPLEDVVAAGGPARYRCVMVAIAPDGREVVTGGTLEGSIAGRARGDEGFGYDPVFVPEGQTQTVAELGDDRKRRHTPRARAAAALRAELLAQA
jgi:XTP/dITP diphosphohydrolase